MGQIFGLRGIIRVIIISILLKFIINPISNISVIIIIGFFIIYSPAVKIQIKIILIEGAAVLK